MAALKTTLLCLLIFKAWVAATNTEEWKTATATYTMETDGSIINEGACGYGDLHRITYGKYSAGLSSILFNRGSTCGACYEMRCVDHTLWCLQGSPSIVLTATDFCPPNFGLSADYGGWCNFPKEHFEMSEAAFAEIAERKADIVRLTMLLRRSGDSVRHSRGSNSDMGMFYNHQNLVSPHC